MQARLGRRPSLGPTRCPDFKADVSFCHIPAQLPSKDGQLNPYWSVDGTSKRGLDNEFFGVIVRPAVNNTHRAVLLE